MAETPAKPDAPAVESKAAEGARTKTGRPLSPGQVAARERQRQCASEWKEAKAGGKVEDGMRWPKYWSQCNARLKGAKAA